jgi:CheY-like chemotaxis protein
MPHCILVVDGDSRSLRLLEVGLAQAGYRVVTATSVADATAVLESEAPDLVIADARGADGGGFALQQAVASRPARVPFLFLLQEDDAAGRMRAAQLGTGEFLIKPVYLKEALSRVALLLEKQAQRGERARFSGAFSGTALLDLLQSMELGRKSGVAYVATTGGQRGTLYFDRGQLVDAELRSEGGAGLPPLAGEDAFFRLLTCEGGEYRVELLEVLRPSRIALPSGGLLMEAMRRLADWQRATAALPPLGSVLVAAPAGALRPESLPPDMRDVLRVFDGHRTITEALTALEHEGGVPRDTLQRLQVMAKLYAARLLQAVGRPISGEPRKAAPTPVGLPRLTPPPLPQVPVAVSEAASRKVPLHLPGAVLPRTVVTPTLTPVVAPQRALEPAAHAPPQLSPPRSLPLLENPTPLPLAPMPTPPPMPALVASQSEPELASPAAARPTPPPMPAAARPTPPPLPAAARPTPPPLPAAARPTPPPMPAVASRPTPPPMPSAGDPGRRLPPEATSSSSHLARLAQRLAASRGPTPFPHLEPLPARSEPEPEAPAVSAGQAATAVAEPIAVSDSQLTVVHSRPSMIESATGSSGSSAEARPGAVAPSRSGGVIEHSAPVALAAPPPLPPPSPAGQASVSLAPVRPDEAAARSGSSRAAVPARVVTAPAVAPATVAQSWPLRLLAIGGLFGLGAGLYFLTQAPTNRAQQTAAPTVVTAPPVPRATEPSPPPAAPTPTEPQDPPTGAAPADPGAAAPTAGAAPPEPAPAAAASAAPPEPEPAPAEPAPATASGASDRFTQLLDKARALQRRGLSRPAERMVRAAQKLQPRSAEAVALLAQLALDEGDAGRATRLAKQAQRLDANNPDAVLVLGTVEQARGHEAKARVLFKRYLELAPSGERASDVRAVLRMRH